MKVNLQRAVLAACSGLVVACGNSSSNGGGAAPDTGAPDTTAETEAPPVDGGAPEAEASLPAEASPPADGGPPTLTVTGTVVDYNGEPRVGSRVLVVGQNLPLATTDGSGHFTISGVTAPYSLATNPDATNVTTLYAGLTRTDPTIAVYRNDGTYTTATVTITVDGNITVDAFFSTKDPRASYLNPQSNELTWYGNTPRPISGSFASPVVDRTGCAGITRYGALPPTTVSPGQSVGAVDIVTQPLASRTLTGSVTVPAGMNFRLLSAVVYPASGGYFGSPIACIPDIANLSFPMPVLSGATPTLLGYADLGDGGTYLTASFDRQSTAYLELTDAGTFQMVLAVPPTIVSPAQASKVVWPPTWRWTAGTSLPHVITLVVRDSNAGAPSVWITAPAGTSFTLPDLSALGVVTTRGQTMSWSLEENTVYASVDAVAAGIPATSVTPESEGQVPVSGTITEIAGDFTVGP